MADRDHFSRNDDPPERARVIPIQKVDGSEHFRVICLSPTIQGFDFHWDDGRTETCTKSTGHCDRCEKKVPYKWYGFLHCLVEPRKKHAFFQLTDFCWRDLKIAAKDLKNLRGVQMVIDRERNNVRSPMRCIITSVMWVDKPYPAEKSVVPTLKRVFNLD
jgi:hypothetical protein